jgi:hypothetical protein
VDFRKRFLSRQSPALVGEYQPKGTTLSDRVLFGALLVVTVTALMIAGLALASIAQAGGTVTG